MELHDYILFDTLFGWLQNLIYQALWIVMMLVDNIQFEYIWAIRWSGEGPEGKPKQYKDSQGGGRWESAQKVLRIIWIFPDKLLLRSW